MYRGFVLLLFLVITGCSDGSRTEHDDQPSSSDSAFAELQERGAAPHAMGVDQYTSVHRFDDLSDGGRIELQSEADNPEDIEQIRTHLRHIAQSFAAGDFQIPEFVHDRDEVPGAAVMSAKRDAVRYEYRDLPRGGEVRISSNDSEAVEAIHEFLAFQRHDHRAGGHEAH